MASVTTTNSTPHYSTDLIPGMDIASTIKAIQDIKLQQVTKAQTEEKTIQTKISDWGDITSSITSLNDSLDTLRSYSTWSKMTVTSSSSAVQAKAGGSATPNTYAIQVAHLAQAHTVASNAAADLGVTNATDDLIAAGTLTAGETFSIAGQTITIGADEYGVTDGGQETITSLQNKINKAAATMTDKVSASIVDNRLVITRATTGSTQIDMSDTGTYGGTPPLQALGILAADETFDAAHVTQLAQNAQFTVNGMSVTRASNTGLTDVIQNVSLTLTGETAGSTVTLDIAHDTATTKNAILDFVANYNAAVTKLKDYSKITLNGASDPTVSDLQNDTLIPDMLQQLRSLATATKSAFFTDADYTYNGKTGKMVSLQDIGVWTTGKDNQLSVTNESRLDEMLSGSFSKVQQLFQGVSTSKGFEHGVAGDFFNYTFKMTMPLSGTIAKHVFTLQTSDKDTLAHIKTMQDAITQQEQDLWAQFSSTQGVIAGMKTSMSWLGGSNNNSSNG